jgi:hypothetical protein
VGQESFLMDEEWGLIQKGLLFAIGEDDHAVDKDMHPEIGNRNISFHRRCWLKPMSSQERHFLSLPITYKVVNHRLI